VHSSIGVLFPVTTITAVISAGGIIESLLVRHRFGAAIALVSSAVLAITEAIRETLCSVIHERIRGKDRLDLPIAIISSEQLFFEVTVLIDVFLLDEDRAFITHIS